MSGKDVFYKLREKYPIFTYEGFSFEIIDNEIDILFSFSIGKDIYFHPAMKLKLGKYCSDAICKEEMSGIIFHIGMIELISYWKSTCSPLIYIKDYTLNNSQQNWWKKLYWKGLGEFRYQNGIDISPSEFVQFSFASSAKPIEQFHYQKIETSQKVIVPIGGGKDSVVTLEFLRQENELVPFIINPRGATLDCARIAGFPAEDDKVILQREIAPKLLELNRAGFLNGHTPFSAMLAFYSLLVSYAVQVREVALSNESSANEPTIPGTEINHQYSKSLEFEEDFRQYVAENMNDCNHYYSFLRSLTELQIAEHFSQFPQYHSVFKSCNTGSKENKWCCNCSKCLFAYIILSPFIQDEKMIEIFGEDLLNKPTLKPYFDELTGVAHNKPFECVGTIEEVNQALRMIRDSRRDKYLIKTHHF